MLQQDVQAAATHQQLNQLHDQQQLPLLQAVINPQQEAAAAQVHGRQGHAAFYNCSFGRRQHSPTASRRMMLHTYVCQASGE